MIITMRLPRAAAEKMGIPVEADADEVEVALPAVELAGRMTLATGRAISPQAVEKHFATSADQAGLSDVLGQSGRKGFGDRFRGRRAPRRAPSAPEANMDVEWISEMLTGCYS